MPVGTLPMVPQRHVGSGDSARVGTGGQMDTDNGSNERASTTRQRHNSSTASQASHPARSGPPLSPGVPTLLLHIANTQIGRPRHLPLPRAANLNLWGIEPAGHLPGLPVRIPGSVAADRLSVPR